MQEDINKAQAKYLNDAVIELLGYNNENDIDGTLERLDLLTEEMRRIKCALIAAPNVTPFTEAQNEEAS